MSVCYVVLRAYRYNTSKTVLSKSTFAFSTSVKTLKRDEEEVLSKNARKSFAFATNFKD
jgi:hypothetical protein